MPIKRAAYKEIRADKKKRFKNISALTAIKNTTKKLNKLISSKNKGKIEQVLKDFSSLLGKAAKKGILPRKTASRKLSRISRKISKTLKSS
ncbi:MAG: 30S ribosomal protein S20 [Candidatus Omnitrophica bacterium]|nr:30S ribosomal protein S20 [Candidatus Omnitrophota bacterium]